ncbi:RNA polymerase subunit sigma [Mycobacterium sp. IDR2000157661]|uniref:RNA polymerase subunit sigma n=1 Tax=Mycobacterium sp. IDR2000157661 TaxID=2867005 RepID=UPI001EEB931E|nr:RNA polymerase subunit sigma [Mycobacterium sp. IDR2000157661]ULE32581.1 RNA polymerase subunit sigma [Mycobacterium sp. IDR2000157661]
MSDKRTDDANRRLLHQLERTQRTSDERTEEVNRRFARQLFTDDGQVLDDEQHQGDDGADEQRRWVRALFADTDQEPVIAGLAAGKTVGRTTPPGPERVDKGR